VAESCTICSSRFRRPIRKLLDTPSHTGHSSANVTVLSSTSPSSLKMLQYQRLIDCSLLWSSRTRLVIEHWSGYQSISPKSGLADVPDPGSVSYSPGTRQEADRNGWPLLGRPSESLDTAPLPDTWPVDLRLVLHDGKDWYRCLLRFDAM